VREGDHLLSIAAIDGEVSSIPIGDELIALRRIEADGSSDLGRIVLERAGTVVELAVDTPLGTCAN
jgi:hypothetical protein